jgi:hypothetical protein
MIYLCSILIAFLTLNLSCKQQLHSYDSQVQGADNLESQNLLAKCGFNSIADLLNEGKRVVDSIKAMKDSDVDFDNSFSIGKAPDSNLQIAIEKSRRDLVQKYQLQKQENIKSWYWASQLYTSYESLRNDPRLVLFRSKNALLLRFEQEKNGHCPKNQGFCTDYLNIAVVINPESVSQFMKQNEPLAIQNLSLIMGHEIGHFSVDIENFYSGGFKNYEELIKSRGNFLKYHLTVDAVSMILHNKTPADFVNALRSYYLVLFHDGKGGEQDEGGDIPERINCLSQLPQK